MSTPRRDPTAAWLERHRHPIAPAERAEIFGLEEVLDVVDGVVDRLASGSLGGDRGLLLSGPPGTGKTLTARYLATRLAAATGREVPFYVLPLDELTPARVRAAFALLDARPEPSILYLDEVDGFARRPFGNPEHPDDRALRLAFLSAMDGTSAAPRRALLVAATNLGHDEVYPSLLRAGRIGRTMVYQLPGEEAATAILTALLAPHTDLDPGQIGLFARVGRNTLSGADYRFVAEDAVARAAARGRRVEAEDVAVALRARGQNVAGRDEKTPPQLREVVLVHETGHAIAISAISGPEAVRSIALFAQMEAKVSLNPPSSEAELLRHAVFARAGRMAEEMVRGTASLGAHADMAAYERSWGRLIINGRWPELSMLFEEQDTDARIRWHIEAVSAPFTERIAAMRRAFDAWVDGNARAALEANRHLLEPIAAAMADTVGADSAAWLRLLEEHGPLTRVELSPLPEILLSFDSRRA
jgi:cell division protease FtsH